jgi:hypothetical protein
MQTPPRFLNRGELADYLLMTYGIEVSAERLARLAVSGGGPRFRLLAGRAGKAVYEKTDVDVWARANLGPVVARVSEHPAHRPIPHKGEAA